MDYRVQLDVFNGPLDLLLYLLKRDELDIYDIPISRILDSYLEYLESLRALHTEGGLDINVAGDFLVMAATLMEIKSAMLLPKQQAVDPNEPSAAAELTDPRYELVQQLLEYKKLKDSAALLESRRREHSQRFARYPVRLANDADEPPPVDLDEVQVWDLLNVFSRLMREVGVRGPSVHEVTDDDTPLELHATDIQDRLKREGHLTLRALLLGRQTRGEMIGVFLALLELVRQRRISFSQTDDLGDIEIEPAPAEGATTEAPAPSAAAPIESPASEPIPDESPANGGDHLPANEIAESRENGD